MKKSKNIHNIDSLEREIYRLKLEVKNIEEKLDDNFTHLQQNFSSMAMNSFLSGRKIGSPQEGLFNSFIKNEAAASFLNKISGHIGNRVMENIDSLIDRAFHRKNKS
jgi:hypothetical protein